VTGVKGADANVSRRAFLIRSGATLATGAASGIATAVATGVAIIPALLNGQQPLPGQVPPATMTGPMDDSALRPVRRDPKPGAVPVVTPERRDAMERGLKCQCACPLDVFTCRTTDFACPVSPAMHRDVNRLIEGGYTEEEIVAAFVETYGERALMAPRAVGFNRVGYIAPFAALGLAGAGVAILLRRWTMRTRAVAAENPVQIAQVDGTPDELARLEAAIRGGER
jgi:cytochrome c-type biogenesis protein CcmH